MKKRTTNKPKLSKAQIKIARHGFISAEKWQRSLTDGLVRCAIWYEHAIRQLTPKEWAGLSKATQKNLGELGELTFYCLHDAIDTKRAEVVVDGQVVEKRVAFPEPDCVLAYGDIFRWMKDQKDHPWMADDSEGSAGQWLDHSKRKK